MKQYQSLDLLKYVLSFFVVAIHSGLFPSITYPWLRLAVPLYFIISSFLLFSKIQSSKSKQEEKALVCKYIKRQLTLYIFWFVLLLPITIIYVYIPMWDDNLPLYIWKIISNLLFSSSFGASWFIVASITAVLLLYITRNAKHWILLSIAVLIYAICCLRSAYYPYIKNHQSIYNAFYWYEFIFTNPVYSFPIAFCWMLLGKVIAYCNNFFCSIAKHRLAVFVSIIFSLSFLFVEWYFVKISTGVVHNDIYISLVPCSLFIFIGIKEIRIKINNSIFLRNISTITYVLHRSLIYVFYPVFESFNINIYLCEILLYLFIVVICHFVSIMLIHLSKHNFLSLLKYSH